MVREQEQELMLQQLARNHPAKGVTGAWLSTEALLLLLLLLLLRCLWKYG
jgi:hypothetical protein